MNAPAPAVIPTWLDLLSKLYPPRHALFIGAGSGSSALLRWLSASAAPVATLVEADDTQFSMLQAAAAGRPGWRVCRQVASVETAPVTFHHASMASESGLLAPEQLRALWPHLASRGQQVRQAVGLAELLREGEGPANWLLVDCWPGPVLVASAAQAMAQVEVVVVRSTLSGADLPNLDFTQAESAIEAMGFRRLAVECGRHPQVGHVLYLRHHPAAQVRDLARALDDASLALKTQRELLAAESEGRRQDAQAHQRHASEGERRIAELQAEGDALRAQVQALRDTAQRMHQDHEVADEQHKAVVRAKATAESRAQALASRVQALEQELARSRGDVVRLQSELDAVMAENASLTALAQQCREQLEVQRLAHEQAQADDARAREQQLQRIGSLEKHVKQLQETEAQLRQMQAAAKEQFTRADAQFALIKELLLGGRT